MIITYDNEEKWVYDGRNFLGASENRILCGLGYETESVIGMWAWKARGLRTGFTPRTAEALKVGKMLEPALATMFFDLVPEVRPVRKDITEIVRHVHEGTLLAATVDEFCIDAIDGLTGVVELKNVGAYAAKEWEEGPPLRVNCQIQQQMMCTGADYGFAFALLGGNKRVAHRVEPDYRFQDAILAKAKEFWHYVDNDIEPPADFSPASVRTLQALHPDDNGETVLLDEMTATWALHLASARQMGKAAEKMELAAKACLMQAMGDNTYGQLPDGRMVSWKTQESQMPAKEAYTKKARVMRVQEPK